MKRKVTTAARLIFGLVFFGFGLNGLLRLFPLPPAQGTAAVFISRLVASRYFFPLLFLIYFLTGAALLSGRFVPLALIILAPIIVNIAVMHIVLPASDAEICLAVLVTPARDLPRLVISRGIPSAAPRSRRFCVAMTGSKPYAQLKYREIQRSRMAYIDEGQGDAIVFQHGQPTSSYVWRNIIPHLEGMGRLIACDLIGMGASDKLDPSLGPNRYSLTSHRNYLFDLWDQLDLGNRVVLVLDDWGAGPGI